MLKPLLPVELPVELPLPLVAESLEPVLPVLDMPLVPVDPLVPVEPLEPLVPDVSLEPLVLPVPLEPLEPVLEEPLVSVEVEGVELLDEPDEPEEPDDPEEPEDPDEPDELALSLGSTTVVVVVTVRALGSLVDAAGLLDAASLGLDVVVVVVPCANTTPDVPMRDKRIASGNLRIQAPLV